MSTLIVSIEIEQVIAHLSHPCYDDAGACGMFWVGGVKLHKCALGVGVCTGLVYSFIVLFFNTNTKNIPIVSKCLSESYVKYG